MNEIKGKTILLLGYGREGQSAHRYLAAQRKGLTIAIADRQNVRALFKATVHTGKSYLKHLDAYDTVIRTPGIPAGLQELTDYKKKGGWVTTATNIFFSTCPGITIGVTGTKGKSTTASLIAHILARSGTSRVFKDVRLVGNIGRPMLDHLDGATKETIFIIELSSHQLEDARYSPHVAVLLAIVPEHLDYYPNFGTYGRAKANIVRFQSAKDAVVFNPTHELVAKLVEQGRSKKLATTSKFDISDIPLKGNRQNILAAVAVARYMGVPEEKITGAVKTFAPLPHRLEFVGEYRGIRFYNDSLATIPEATIHALDALGGDVATLIVGGHERNLDYSKLGAYIIRHAVQTLILFPVTGQKILKAMKSVRGTKETKTHAADSMEEAVKLAYKHTPKGKICLLSPASASFNLFKNYEDRGEQFKTWVKNLGAR